MRSVFDERFSCYKGASTPTGFITVDLIQKCKEGLKKGKAAGLDGLMAEHICFAHPILSVHLSCFLRCNISIVWFQMSLVEVLLYHCSRM